MAPQDKDMNFFDHIEELRWHIFRSAIVVIIVTILIFIFSRFVFEDIIFGPLSQDFISYKVLCMLAKDFCGQNISVKLINSEIGGQFFMHIKTSFTLGIMASVPYFLWEIWRFICPALHQNERSYAIVLLGFGFLLFLCGALLGYFVIFPITLLFLTSYQISDSILNLPNINNYFDNMTSIVLWTGVVFELPILAYFLAKMGVITTSFLSTYRRHLYVVIMVVAAAITPSPDILSMMLVALPLFVLFEASIIVVRRVEKFKSQNLEF